MADITLPTPGVTSGPTWATMVNAALTAINDDVETRATAASTNAAIWIGTSAAYAAITPKVATTLYHTTD